MTTFRGAVKGLATALFWLVVIQLTIILVENIGFGYTAAGWFIVVMIALGIAMERDRA